MLLKSALLGSVTERSEKSQVIKAIYKKKSLAHTKILTEFAYRNTKKSGADERLRVPRVLRHGFCAHAEVEGFTERVPVYFNAYVNDGRPWIERWMSLEDLRKTPKPLTEEERRTEARRQKYRIQAGATSSPAVERMFSLMSLRVGAPQLRSA